MINLTTSQDVSGKPITSDAIRAGEKRSRGDTANFSKLAWPAQSCRRFLSIITGILYKISHFVYRGETFHILSFNLGGRAIPSPKTSAEVVIRLLTWDDISCFLELWEDQRALKRTRFKQRMANGYIGIGAWHKNKLIGVNWLAHKQDLDSLTGILIKLAPGCCFALDLQEDENHKGQRVGLATLSYSLSEARRRGFKTQFITVSEFNEKMLAGAKYLMGYKKIGEIKTSYWFQKPFSRWKIGDIKGKSKVLILGN